LGQNLGAGLIDRVRRTVLDALVLILAYCLFIWAVLFFSRHWIVSLFDVTGAGADLVLVFCSIVSAGFLFNGALFVANASFNNLGQPVLSTVFNWGRATVGTVPFVLVGAAYAGATGVLIGQALGGIVFGVLAVVFCFRAIDRIARRAPAAVGTRGSGA
jgi:Na+-driven multidrug efflux pump